MGDMVENLKIFTVENEMEKLNWPVGNKIKHDPVSSLLHNLC